MEIKLKEQYTLDIDDDLDVRCENDIEKGSEDGWVTVKFKHARIIVRRKNTTQEEKKIARIRACYEALYKGIINLTAEEKEALIDKKVQEAVRKWQE